MRAIILAIICLLPAYSSAESSEVCHAQPAVTDDNWVTMVGPCIADMKTQIQMEVGASVTYLAMGAHFSRDQVNRPGFAKMFFDAAAEEREHAMKLIEYLLMRGELTSKITDLIKIEAPPTIEWTNGVHALEDALQLEHTVTNSIRRVIATCEHNNFKFNDYHLVDYLTGDFLEEQYKGQRDLAGKAVTLKKMLADYGGLGEFLFDKKLLGMDV